MRAHSRRPFDVQARIDGQSPGRPRLFSPSYAPMHHGRASWWTGSSGTHVAPGTLLLHSTDEHSLHLVAHAGRRRSVCPSHHRDGAQSARPAANGVHDTNRNFDIENLPPWPSESRVARAAREASCVVDGAVRSSAKGKRHSLSRVSGCDQSLASSSVFACGCCRFRAQHRMPAACCW